MRLLSKKEIDSSQQIQQEQAFKEGEAINKFVAEETRKLNDMRTKFAREKASLEEEAGKFLEELKALKTEKINEITSLEQRRKMIEESSDEQHWTQRHNEVIEKEKELSEKQKDLDVKAEALEKLSLKSDERVNEIERLARETVEKEILLERVEKDLSHRESSIGASESQLNQEKALFEESYSKKNSEIEDKTRQANLLIKANELLKEELDQQLALIERDKRAIRDGYENLAKARKEILGRDD